MRGGGKWVPSLVRFCAFVALNGPWRHSWTTYFARLLRGTASDEDAVPWSANAHGGNLPLRSRPVLDPRVKSMVTKTCVMCSADTGSLMEISVATWSHECQDLSPIMHRRQGTTYRKQTRLLEKGQSFTAIVRYPLEPSPATQSTV